MPSRAASWRIFSMRNGDSATLPGKETNADMVAFAMRAKTLF
jgi:hypothetical protein